MQLPIEPARLHAWQGLMQLELQQTVSTQLSVVQSPLVPQCSPCGQAGQLSPPQSTSVSLPSFTPSTQETVQVPPEQGAFFWQSVELPHDERQLFILQISPPVQLTAVPEVAQLPEPLQ
jgi:hypothetical protein